MYKFGTHDGILTSKTEDGRLYMQLKVGNCSIDLPASCWLTFILNFGVIEQAVSEVIDGAGQYAQFVHHAMDAGSHYVRFLHHIGRGWHVTIRSCSSLLCIRRFYLKGDEIKPSRQGVELNVDYNEWDDLRSIAIKTLTDIPELLNVLPACDCDVTKQCEKCSN
jgi:hypothetical protein